MVDEREHVIQIGQYGAIGKLRRSVDASGRPRLGFEEWAGRVLTGED